MQAAQTTDSHIKMMDQFAELNDEIGADDWTIAREEITRRKLIKQTPRYRIYKADWFGDVTVYEPIASTSVRRQRRLKRASRPNNARGACQNSVIERDEFETKLNELCLHLNAAVVNSQQGDFEASAQGRDSVDLDSGADSAYSSISSSPQYFTKHNLGREFEFPAAQNLEDRTRTTHEQQQEALSSQPVISEGPRSVAQRRSPPNSPLVVLNRDSFSFSFGDVDSDCCNHHHHADGGMNEDDTPVKDSNYNHSACNSSVTYETGATREAPTTSADWFELNELRLVAHENFMLFMGASIGGSAGNVCDGLERSASLVMEMSHPKSVSLHNLLHATTTITTSVLSSPGFAGRIQTSSDRFFAPIFGNHHHHHHQLTTAAKLNICQQVTDAMTYLHDKNIVHGRLTSTNVYLEPNQRVKISLIDTDERQIGAAIDHSDSSAVERKTEARTGFASAPSAAFNLPTLTYLSPELVRTIRLSPGRSDNQQAAAIQMDLSALTKEADVFSFGTLLFELFEERFPFAEPTNAQCSLSTPMTRGSPKLLQSLGLDSPTTPRSAKSPNFHFPSQLPKSDGLQRARKSHTNGNIKLSASELIYQLGSGQIARRNNTDSLGGAKSAAHQKSTPALVKHIISACWTSEPTRRPDFKQLRFQY